MRYDVLVVGAGFAGAVSAQRHAEAGRRVLVIDRRSHTGGNCHDRLDEHGVLIQPYGPHIFHTNSARVFDYLSRFTRWRPYEHRVLADVGGVLYPMPINRTTINRLKGWTLSEDEVARYLESVRVAVDPVKTSEDVVIGSVGHELCDLFFRGYTKKQWGLDLSELSAAVAGRVRVRTSDDDRYFTDIYQCMPERGFAALFDSLLTSPLIDTQLEVEFDRGMLADFSQVIYTGRIDAFFDSRLGELPYRSIRFAHEHHAGVERFQQAAVVNYPGNEPYTRVTEFKQLTGQAHTGTSIAREYAGTEGEPCYPVPRPETERLAQAYRALAAEVPAVSFVGRLAQYRYFNMDQVVEAALDLADREVAGRG